MIAMSDLSEYSGLKEMCLKIYEQGNETLIAVCDYDILGQSFKEENLHLDVSPDFFGTELATGSEVEEALAGATMANLIGCKTVEHAISLGYVDRENVLSIGGILYAQMVRF
jgi:uncharacterized protein